MTQALDISNLSIIATFIVGYACIIFEEKISINKATSALLMSVILWALQFANTSEVEVNVAKLSEHLAGVSQVILFLLGALTIVEIIHAHGGLNLLSRFMKIRSKAASLWVIGILTFFLSAILDNLTTTIVMVMMLRKMIQDTNERLIFGSAVVIAANAGGVWTPIGDVTTTMLWVGGQISTEATMKTLFFPSLVCFAASLIWFSFLVKGEHVHELNQDTLTLAPKGRRVFVLGMLSLIAVPIFKALTGLPPFMGILFSMSFMWLVTDLLHSKHGERQHLRVTSLLPNLDLSGILFFLGILLSIGALETAGVLKDLASFLDRSIPSKELVAVVIGIVSAIIDNVPLVAACTGMYPLSTFAQDSSFWQLVAYCAGTGGSLLIIGSAAGVAFMGMEKVDFFWYVKKVTFPAALGYFAGVLVYYFVFLI